MPKRLASMGLEMLKSWIDTSLSSNSRSKPSKLNLLTDLARKESRTFSREEKALLVAFFRMRLQ